MLWYHLIFLSKKKYIAKVGLDPLLICRQIMIYLFWLDLYFNNAGNNVEGKEHDLFLNTLEVTMRSRNELLIQIFSNMLKSNVLEFGDYALGFFFKVI